MEWWNFAENLRGKKILYAVPAIILWELWKGRNSKRHDKDISYAKIYHNCFKTVQQLMKATYPELRMPPDWVGYFELIQRYRSKLTYKLVKWECPEAGWIKCNTDGASKGNPRLSSYDFCIRN